MCHLSITLPAGILIGNTGARSVPGSWFFSRLASRFAEWRRMMAFSGLTSQCEERGFGKIRGTAENLATPHTGVFKTARTSHALHTTEWTVA
jgi:hypothetical protein